MISNRGKTSMKRTQSGITLLGFIVVLGVVGLFAYVGMKLFPMYSEFYAVKSALKGIALESGSANLDRFKIQDLLYRRFNIGYVESVKPEDIKITRVDNGWKVEISYEVRKPLISNLDVVGKFDATQTLSNTNSPN